MTGLCKENFFFFNEDCSKMEITPMSLEHAYLALLNDDLKTAGIVFSKNDSPRGNWGRTLVSILEGFMTVCPSFFQIRNFLEIDVDFLLKNNKIGYVEQFLGALEILSAINQETFKFAARVMLENHLYLAGLKYMERSKEIYYNDPELHFMLAKYYYDKRQYREAKEGITECLKLLPEYYPAQILRQRIDELLI